MVMLGAHTLVDLLSLVVAFERQSLVSAVIDDPESIDMSAAEANDSWYALSGVAQMTAFVLTGIVFVIWLYRARRNAEAITPIEHRRSTGLVVFAWIIPIVNLWVPKQIVDDIWVTSALQNPPLNPLHPDALRNAPRSPLVRGWWLSWLVAIWVSSLFYRVGARGEDLESELLMVRTEIWFAVPTLICAVLAVLVVMTITKTQERRRLAPVPGPAPGPVPGV